MFVAHSAGLDPSHSFWLNSAAFLREIPWVLIRNSSAGVSFYQQQFFTIRTKCPVCRAAGRIRRFYPRPINRKYETGMKAFSFLPPHTKARPWLLSGLSAEALRNLSIFRSFHGFLALVLDGAYSAKTPTLMLRKRALARGRLKNGFKIPHVDALSRLLCPY